MKVSVVIPKLMYFPIVLTLCREKRSLLHTIKDISMDAVILFPALYFLSKLDFVSYTLCFLLFYIASWIFYEIGYLLNDYIAVKYEDVPFEREYTKYVEFKLALIIRIAVLTLIIWLNYNLPFLILLILLGVVIILYNSLKQKVDRIIIRPYMRLIKAMIVPFAMSNLNFYILYPCIVLYLPLLVSITRSATLSVIIDYYHNVDPFFDKPFYVACAIFLPLQIIILWGYPLQIFIGELIFALSSAGVKLRWRKKKE